MFGSTYIMIVLLYDFFFFPPVKIHPLFPEKIYKNLSMLKNQPPSKFLDIC